MGLATETEKREIKGEREGDSYTHVIMQLAIFVTVAVVAAVHATSIYRKIKSYVINTY